MAAFLFWLRSIFLSVLNGVARFVVFLVLLVVVMTTSALRDGSRTWT